MQQTQKTDKFRIKVYVVAHLCLLLLVPSAWRIAPSFSLFASGIISSRLLFFDAIRMLCKGGFVVDCALEEVGR